MYSKSSLRLCSVLCVDLRVNSWLKKVDDVTPVVSGGHGGIRFTDLHDNMDSERQPSC